MTFLSLQSEAERQLFIIATTFLDGRLEEKPTFDWALELPPSKNVERLAVLHCLERLDGLKLKEPWATAWHMLEEAWTAGPPPERQPGIGLHRIRQRLAGGDTSGALIGKLVDLVLPRIELRPLSPLDRSVRAIPRRPRTWTQMLSARLVSGEVVDPDAIRLFGIENLTFLQALANRLDDAVRRGIEIGTQIGWDDKSGFWRLGELYRVYFVPQGQRPQGHDEPDKFHRGIAPAVKLLFSTVARISQLSLPSAATFVGRWKSDVTPVHRRLWAAIARDRALASGDEVASFLINVDPYQFWNFNSYPEIAELRAVRFADLSDDERDAVVVRLLRGPARSLWRGRVDDARLETVRTHWIAQELRRIQIAGGVLPERGANFLRAHPDADLADMARVDAGFLESVRAETVAPDPDRKYDALRGVDRLSALQASLVTARRSWRDDPAERAMDWIREDRHTDALIDDFETANGGHEFPNVWEAFGWMHHVPGGNQPQRDDPQHSALADRVIALVARLPDDVQRKTIDGLTHWLSNWERVVAAKPAARTLWLHLWPLAVESTNAKQSKEEPPDLNVSARVVGDHEPEDLDTLNTPAARLVGMFLSCCPNLRGGANPFVDDRSLGQMRSQIVAAGGRSGLIGRHRLIESLGYFLTADRDWTERELVTPLRSGSEDSLPLWRALARRTLPKAVIQQIGNDVAIRATDARIGRESRRSLAWSLVISSLHSFFAGEDPPPVPHATVLQMLRSVDDDVRSHAADAVSRFVTEVEEATVELKFRRAARPFLENVWPRERAVATRGVAKAFARLPAACGDAFAEAVGAVERFLVPFDCWSMLDYGLYGEDDGQSRLAAVNNEEKARALLHLLENTISKADGAVIPMDLGSALERVREVAPRLADSHTYRSLATLARRVS